MNDIDNRPDPDRLLERIRLQETSAFKGKLKVFLGAAPGVGKTYTMLESARALKKQGVDVVVGIVEVHGRRETEALLEGFEVLQRVQLNYRDQEFEEFDLDAALERRPAILLVDELAHTNIPGSRHTKRFQDILELLEAGIDVHTTLNVQHLESVNDIVEQITGVKVQETLPDHILDRADEIKLVDVSAGDLIQRLEEGKIYPGQALEHALRNFFKRGNLIALRELSLRQVADRMDEDLHLYRRSHDIHQVWRAVEKVLVCVGPSPLSARVVRIASRIAKSLRSEWTAVSVETPRVLRMPDQAKARVHQHLHLAQELGAETRILAGENIGEEILSYARTHNISLIIIGKPANTRWRDLIMGSLVDDLIRKSGDIEIYVVQGGSSENSSAAPALQKKPAFPYKDYSFSLAIVSLCTAIPYFLRRFISESDVIVFFMAGIFISAFCLSRRVSYVTALLSVAAFDFFFIPPFFTFRIHDTRYLLTFIAIAAVGVLMGNLVDRIKEQAQAARTREYRTFALFRLTQKLAKENDKEALMQSAALHLHETFKADVTLFLADEEEGLVPFAYVGDPITQVKEITTAEWCFINSKPAGNGTQTLPSAVGLYLPLGQSNRTFGVVGVCPAEPKLFHNPDQRQFLESMILQIGFALERYLLAESARQAQVQIETEQMRSSLLSSVSHDLRTPLGAILGSVTGLLDQNPPLNSDQIVMLETIREESRRLARLLQNLLEMTKIEGGGMKINKDWNVPEEAIGSALRQLSGLLKDRTVKVAVDSDSTLVQMDGLLVELVLVNLIENAAKYSPPHSEIKIHSSLREQDWVVEIGDRGSGFFEGEEKYIFNKFYRSNRHKAHGAGLGLSICTTIVEAHGGNIWARNRTDSPGAVVGFSIPVDLHSSDEQLQKAAEMAI